MNTTPRCVPTVPGGAHPRQERRSQRVMVLLIAIVILSGADLALTAAHLSALGMVEANPIAAFIIRSTRSLWALSLYKLLTVGISVALIFRLRRHIQGELAAWIAASILLALSVHWHRYARQVGELDHVQLAQTDGESERVLRLDEGTAVR